MNTPKASVTGAAEAHVIGTPAHHPPAGFLAHLVFALAVTDTSVTAFAARTPMNSTGSPLPATQRTSH